MSIEKKNNKVLQPMRFVDANYAFTPIQKDFIMMVQYKTFKQQSIKNDFSIDLKPYFNARGMSLEDVRHNHFKEITTSLLESKVTFKYFKGNKLYTHQNLFSRCTVTKDFKLEVSIVDDALPLFYINKLQEGHFQDNRLVKELFEKSYPEFDNYIAFLPKVYVQFKESSVKKLYEKLLQYRKLKKHTYEFSKDELYLLLGYGYLRDKKESSQANIFNITEQEFIQTHYEGVEGWKNLSRMINKWLKEISDHKESGVMVKKTKTRYFSTNGRPIRSIFIDVQYDDKLVELTDDQRDSYEVLKPFNLSDSQIFTIVAKFECDTIKTYLNDFLIKKRDSFEKVYWGERARADHRKIDNIPGFIFAKVFGMGRKK